MSQKTNAAETMVLQWLLTSAPVTRPTQIYVALHSADPTEAGDVAEMSGNGYSRQLVSFSVTADQAVNTDTITFGPAVTSEWVAASHFSLWTAQTGGSCLYHGQIVSPSDSVTPAPVTVIVNGRAEFAPGALVVIEA